jgi:hypothetical protein
MIILLNMVILGHPMASPNSGQLGTYLENLRFNPNQVVTTSAALERPEPGKTRRRKRAFLYPFGPPQFAEVAGVVQT